MIFTRPSMPAACICDTVDGPHREEGMITNSEKCRRSGSCIIGWLALLMMHSMFLPSRHASAQPGQDGEKLQYHIIRTDSSGRIVPWFSDDPGLSYDHVIRLVWNFWKNMETDSNGMKYYMNHQVWKPEHDMRGLGGDQFNMALSSWRLLYAYTGDPSVIQNMRTIADEYLARSLSGPDDAWPDMPYPYNNKIHSGKYTGDMVIGEGFTKPDKAGAFGSELVNLYKMTGEQRYLDAAVRIANSLAAHTKPGDNGHSPLPFKVNAKTGEPGYLKNWQDGTVQASVYTSNWTGVLDLFESLSTLGEGDAKAYIGAFNLILDWMIAVPLATNKWGPFFEDIPGWSDTQTNAVTFAAYILEHPERFRDYRSAARSALDWAWRELGNHDYEKVGVIVMNEQTAYRVPGNSHTSRQAAVELLYCEKTGDISTRENALRCLNWATYMVDTDGKNRYMRDDIWLTDGYGDYVRHYIRAMASAPWLAPCDADHLLRTSSVVTNIEYGASLVSYTLFDSGSLDVLRMTAKPKRVLANGRLLKELRALDREGWTWQDLEKGGVLCIRQDQGRKVVIEK